MAALKEEKSEEKITEIGGFLWLKTPYRKMTMACKLLKREYSTLSPSHELIF